MQEVLANPLVSGRVANTMAAREVSSLKAFMEMMARDSARAFYGPGHVFAANEIGVYPLCMSACVCVCACLCCACARVHSHVFACLGMCLRLGLCCISVHPSVHGATFCASWRRRMALGCSGYHSLKQLLWWCWACADKKEQDRSAAYPGVQLLSAGLAEGCSC